MNNRIVITGIGVLASNGIGKDHFWNSLEQGESGAKSVTLFDTSKTRSKLAGEISNFDPQSILGKKGLRNLDRSTKLACCAAKLALDDAGISNPISEDETDKFGVSLGSTMGSVWSISEFDKESLREGPRAVNPALFPNTVINSPASNVSIKFNIQGFNTTIATGFSSGLDAIYYAMNMLDQYEYDVVLAGGVEELCEQTYKGFHKIGHLAGSRTGKTELNCPFDKRRNGILMGEGSAILVLETLKSALKRKAKIYAEILGYGTSFDLKSRNIYSPKAVGATEAIENALEDAKLKPEDIDYVSGSANSTLDCDVMETRAIKKVFNARARTMPISAVKSMIGECFSASGALQAVATVGTIEKNTIFPTAGYKDPDRRCNLDYVPNESRYAEINKVIINSLTPTGSNSVLALSRYK